MVKIEVNERKLYSYLIDEEEQDKAYYNAIEKVIADGELMIRFSLEARIINDYLVYLGLEKCEFAKFVITYTYNNNEYTVKFGSKIIKFTNEEIEWIEDEVKSLDWIDIESDKLDVPYDNYGGMLELSNWDLEEALKGSMKVVSFKPIKRKKGV